jgi:hypothetical protein
VPPEPNAWWRDKLAAHLGSLDRVALLEWLARWLPRFAETVAPGEISTSGVRGLLHTAGALADEGLVPTLATVLETTQARAPAVARACIPVLAPFATGRTRLQALASRVEHPALRHRIEAALAGAPE